MGRHSWRATEKPDIEAVLVGRHSWQTTEKSVTSGNDLRLRGGGLRGSQVMKENNMISEVQGLQSLLVNRAESAVNSVGNAEKSSENAEISQAKQSSPNIDEYVPSGEREHTGL